MHKISNTQETKWQSSTKWPLFFFGVGGEKKSSWGKKYSIPLIVVMTWAFHSTIVDEGFQPSWVDLNKASQIPWHPNRPWMHDIYHIFSLPYLLKKYWKPSMCIMKTSKRWILTVKIGLVWISHKNHMLYLNIKLNLINHTATIFRSWTIRKMLSTNCTSKNLSFPVTLPGLTSGRLEFFSVPLFFFFFEKKRKTLTWTQGACLLYFCFQDLEQNY